MKTIVSIFVLWIAAATAWADIVPPPPAGPRVIMRIGQDATGAGGPVLEIPAKLLRANHAGLIDIAPGFPGRSSASLVIAGVLLSLAIFLFGRAMWKKREQKRSQQNLQSSQAGKLGRGAHMMLAVAALFAAGMLMKTASADDARLNPGNLNLAAASGPLEGQVVVRVTDGDAVILHLTPPRHPVYHGPRQPNPRP
jgi:hypothetical protein